MTNYKAAYELLAESLAEQDVDVAAVKAALKQQQIALNNMAVSMGSNRLTVDGVVRGIPRRPVIDVDLRAPAIDLPSMEEIYPFFRAYLPKGLVFTGAVALDSHARGDMDGLDAGGTLDADRKSVV